MDLNLLINELVAYGCKESLVEEADRVYVTNRLLELFGEINFEEKKIEEVRPVAAILADLLQVALEKGLMEDDTITRKDLFDTKIMGLLTPQPSSVIGTWKEKLAKDPKEATDWYYHFSKATNYIREDRIVKDEKWTVDTPYGVMDMTINLSKPEKDPREIAALGKAAKSAYPACLLCMENEGYAGHLSHPARQNHRILPLQLEGEDYFLQYSPYVYYNEHCIVFNKKHIPMKVNGVTLRKLLDFVDQLPHYSIGSNAGLPIVGGSILSHDHFQGGCYEFPIFRAAYEEEFTLASYPEVKAGIICWPMSTIRLQCKDKEKLAQAGTEILEAWEGYSDPSVQIYAKTDGEPHNAVTPLVRRRGELFEMDLVLRNNLTTEEHPMGLYHPYEEYHHIKKENIGLIEVMGLAILPARLKKELAALEQVMLGEGDYSDPALAFHEAWAKAILEEQKAKGVTLNSDNIHQVIQEEIGVTFTKILECCGVFKRDAEGKEAFRRFTGTL